MVTVDCAIVTSVESAVVPATVSGALVAAAPADIRTLVIRVVIGYTVYDMTADVADDAGADAGAVAMVNVEAGVCEVATGVVDCVAGAALSPAGVEARMLEPAFRTGT